MMLTLLYSLCMIKGYSQHNFTVIRLLGMVQDGICPKHNVCNNLIVFVGLRENVVLELHFLRWSLNSFNVVCDSFTVFFAYAKRPYIVQCTPIKACTLEFLAINTRSAYSIWNTIRSIICEIQYQ